MERERGSNMAHIRQSRPDSGVGFQVKFFNFLSRSLFARQRCREGRRGTEAGRMRRELVRGYPGAPLPSEEGTPYTFVTTFT